MSDRWIRSLFTIETARLTPLDFRLSAASQFRFMLIACNLSTVSITNLQNQFAQDQLVSAEILSPTSFKDHFTALTNKFFAMMDMKVSPSFACNLVMTIIIQAIIHSAINTDAFTTSIPGSNQYNTISNFYPLHDNVNYSGVSIL